MGNFYLVIIDGLGVGAQEDADQFGDTGSNTLGHVSAATQCRLPNMEELGLGNIIPLDSVAPVKSPRAAFGKMREVSAGKDSTTGHWEIAGVQLEQPFPVYPEGFPQEVIDQFCRQTGDEKVLANKPASGTQIIEEYGEEHLKTGYPIVYTSADSVFQVATHEGVTPVETLYQWCKTAREHIMTEEHGVGRVIARPFTGEPGNFYRLSDQRHDYSLIPPQPCLPHYLQGKGVETVSIGKVIDLFAETGFDQIRRTKSNAEGLQQLIDAAKERLDNRFIFANLIDTDQVYGHRNDVTGFARALEEIDRYLPDILKELQEDDILVLTGDHGNDPTTESTDHAREFTPLLVYPAGRPIAVDLCTRETFSDIAASVCKYFDNDNPFPGTSFLK